MSRGFEPCGLGLHSTLGEPNERTISIHRHLVPQTDGWFSMSSAGIDRRGKPCGSRAKRHCSVYNAIFSISNFTVIRSLLTASPSACGLLRMLVFEEVADLRIVRLSGSTHSLYRLGSLLVGYGGDDSLTTTIQNTVWLASRSWR